MDPLAASRGVILAAAAASNLFGQVFPTRTVDVPLTFDGTTGRSRWIAGYLPNYLPAVNGAKPKVWMRDRSGKMVIPETEISFPDAFRVDIWDVAADRSGYLYAGIEAWSADGNGTGAICKVAP